jgi:hypothetical protein
MYKEIIGTWKLDPIDINSQQIYGDVSIEFKSNGKLIYTIHLEGKEQKMFMTYEIRGNLLVTDQPSSPHKEETEFRILPDGKLELCFSGIKSKYIKDLKII